MTTAPTSLPARALRRWASGVWWCFVSVMVVSTVVTVAAVSGSLRSHLVGVGFVLLVGAFPLTGWLILRRQPRNLIGWVLLGIGVAWGVGGLTDAYATYGWYLTPGSLPGPGVAAALNQGSWAPGIGIMGTFLILLYPSGRLPSPRWRWLAWASGGVIAVIWLGGTVAPGRMTAGPGTGRPNPIALPQGGDLVLTVVLTAVALLPVCIGLSALALVLRFRSSTGVERQQLTWLAAAGAVVAVLFIGSMASSLLPRAGGGEEPALQLLVQDVSLGSFLLIPAAIGVAVLRHRLYDIDVVVNRALVYVALTVSLLGVYLVSVLLLRRALAPLTGDSDLAVAASTLAVAAVFRPLRSRIQAGVDWRFYRRRYDAGLTLRAFGDRLRREVDLSAVSADLRGVVGDTMQPEHVSLWLRGAP